MFPTRNTSQEVRAANKNPKHMIFSYAPARDTFQDDHTRMQRPKQMTFSYAPTAIASQYANTP